VLIKVVCTDRGQHPKRQLGFTGSTELGAVPVVLQQVQRRPDGSGSTYRFKCRTCGRDVQLREEVWRRIVDGLVEAGQSTTDAAGGITVDVSFLF
jgi:hypothetical protein